MTQWFPIPAAIYDFKSGNLQTAKNARQPLKFMVANYLLESSTTDFRKASFRFDIKRVGKLCCLLSVI